MARHSLTRAPRGASPVLVIALFGGCAASPAGPARPPDSGPRGEGIAFRDLRPTADADGAAVAADAAAGIPLAQLAAAIKQAKCEGLVACKLAPDAATCLGAVVGWPELEQLSADVAAGRVAYDPVQAAACVELYRGRDCPALWFDVAARAAACQGTFRGIAALGAPCFRHEVCGSGRCGDFDCARGARCCGGKCLENPERSLGESCSAGRCAAGAICFEQILGPPLCDTPSVAGEDCWQHADCVAGLLCGGALPQSIPGQCYAPARSGETCDRQLGGAACARLDEWCDAAEQRCRPRVPVGEACDARYESCVVMAYCDGDGRCTVRPGRDEPCDMFSRPCLGELICDGNCALAVAAEPCP